ncbi:MAG: hypothetical protein N3E47_02525 [Candidatus Bathyarchaeota archaeon]|nr:hypothetical protein [Candidatus Bathyarchaeota archaeon]
MKKTFLNLIFAAVLGATLALMPLLFLRINPASVDVEAFDEMKTETPENANLVDRDESAETLAIPKAPVTDVNWLDLALKFVLGAISAAAISIIVKRKLRV